MVSPISSVCRWHAVGSRYGSMVPRPPCRGEACAFRGSAGAPPRARYTGKPCNRGAAERNPWIARFSVTTLSPKILRPTRARACCTRPTAISRRPSSCRWARSATVKGIPWETVHDLGAQIVLSNTYHLAMRPGADLIAEMGGLHAFMNWHGPILTDSGGFQVFSHWRRGQAFRRGRALHRHGLRRQPCVLDARGQHGHRAEAGERHLHAARPVHRLSRRASRRGARHGPLEPLGRALLCKAHTRPDQALFGIVQGGMHLDLRVKSLQRLEDMGDFPGYGIGGYSVGEEPRDHVRVARAARGGAHAAHQAALPHGGGQPHHARARRGLRHRHVRLRAAHAHGPHGVGVQRARGA